MITMFGIRITPLTLEEATERIIDMAKDRRKGLVVTPNVDHVVTLHRDAVFREIYSRASLVLADGMPLVWLSKLLPGPSLPGRVTGADLLETVCAAAGREGLTIGFVGGAPGVAERASVCLRERNPGLKIVGTYSPPFGFENDSRECEKIVDIVNEWAPDILFVGLGAPKQEKWSDKWLARMDCGPVLCTGAAFDFAAGVTRRAPKWVQRSGLEWVWRMMRDPKRLVRRYLIRDVVFLLYAVEEIVKNRCGASSWI